jgi:hypothetical protein
MEGDPGTGKSLTFPVSETPVLEGNWDNGEAGCSAMEEQERTDTQLPRSSAP